MKMTPSEKLHSLVRGKVLTNNTLKDQMLYDAIEIILSLELSLVTPSPK